MVVVHESSQAFSLSVFEWVGGKIFTDKAATSSKCMQQRPAVPSMAAHGASPVTRQSLARTNQMPPASLRGALLPPRDPARVDFFTA